MPSIRIAGILLASALGLALLREPFTLRYGLGVAFAITGIYLIVVR